MKSVYLAAAIGAFAATTVHGQCACAPTDSVCLSECGNVYDKNEMSK